MRKFVAVAALALGVTAAAAGMASADPYVPGPNAVGPFTAQGEPTGKAACEAAAQASGAYSSCYEYPDDGSGHWYYNKSN